MDCATPSPRCPRHQEHQSHRTCRNGDVRDSAPCEARWLPPADVLTGVAPAVWDPRPRRHHDARSTARRQPPTVTKLDTCYPNRTETTGYIGVFFHCTTTETTVTANRGIGVYGACSRVLSCALSGSPPAGVAVTGSRSRAARETCVVHELRFTISAASRVATAQGWCLSGGCFGRRATATTAATPRW